MRHFELIFVQDLSILHDWVKRIQLLNNMKPLVQENDFDGIKLAKNDGILVQNSRFKTRVRTSRQVRWGKKFSRRRLNTLPS